MDKQIRDLWTTNQIMVAVIIATAVVFAIITVAYSSTPISDASPETTSTIRPQESAAPALQVSPTVEARPTQAPPPSEEAEGGDLPITDDPGGSTRDALINFKARCSQNPEATFTHVGRTFVCSDIPRFLLVTDSGATSRVPDVDPSQVPHAGFDRTVAGQDQLYRNNEWDTEIRSYNERCLEKGGVPFYSYGGPRVESVPGYYTADAPLGINPWRDSFSIWLYCDGVSDAGTEFKNRGPIPPPTQKFVEGCVQDWSAFPPENLQDAGDTRYIIIMGEVAGWDKTWRQLAYQICVTPEYLAYSLGIWVEELDRSMRTSTISGSHLPVPIKK